MTSVELKLPDWYNFESEPCNVVHEGSDEAFDTDIRSYRGTIKNTPGCSTSACNALSQQLIHQMNVMNPNTLVNFDDLNVSLKNAAFPYLQAIAKAALARAIQERGKTMTVNSGYRTIAQQLLLFNWGRSCGYPVVARPGRSNHQSGLALDLNDYNGWKPYLQKHGWRWFGSNDKPHFDYVGTGAKDLSQATIKAFQQLWNNNNPSKTITVDGSWGPQTDRGKLLNTLGVAVVSAELSQMRSLRISTAENSPILAIEPERVVYTSSGMTKYLQGYRDGVNHLCDSLVPTEPTQLLDPLVDESVATWGLETTKVLKSSSSGRGIKVAVLDTGFDFDHPDFMGRNVISQSFIEGEEVQDRNGHGTHCTGTACGTRQPTQQPRYGVAYNSEIYVGKVLSNEGRGADGGILQGIEWALENGCHIISMSLGSPTKLGDTYSQIYETVAQRALRRGTLIIAAAGNESDRASDSINPVGRPANSPSIMAVAALDSQLGIANFSNRGLNPEGGQVDIAAPGVEVYSSWPMPTQYRTISGTSMATPHVAGIAALHAEATGLRGQELWNHLTQTARRLSLASEDVGTGLVQAP